MPEKATRERAKKDLREGKSASTAAGEFVREEIDHVREGKHGARSPQQAIAIGLSKARRAGVPLKPPSRGKTSEETRSKAGELPGARRDPYAWFRTLCSSRRIRDGNGERGSRTGKSHAEGSRARTHFASAARNQGPNWRARWCRCPVGLETHHPELQIEEARYRAK